MGVVFSFRRWPIRIKTNCTIRNDQMTPNHLRYRYLLCLSLFALLGAQSVLGQTLPHETPQKFEPTNYGFDYVRREVMMRMRDGVKLHTVVLVPKGAKDAPILLTRTPYNANELTTHTNSSHLGPSLEGYDNATDVIVEGGYILSLIHISEPTRLLSTSYAVFCLKKKKQNQTNT